MDLFDYVQEEHSSQYVPLAERMKPRNLKEFIGQHAVVGAQSQLSHLIASDQVGSLIFHGPPGVGKTSLARIIAAETDAEFITINAVTAGKSDIKEAVAQAKEYRSLYQRKTIVFIDEIHRFNKVQQDALLPYIESGLIICVGATTENPYFEINAALLSRAMVFRLSPLAPEDILTLLHTALEDEERGLGMYQVKVSEGALEEMVHRANGDARRALNTLEMSVLSKMDLNEEVVISVDDVQYAMMMSYDKKGDHHYDIVSAFIKSMRGSDPDAAMYYMAQMLRGGEDPAFIARRIIICAAEDVGNADPMALVLATSAAQATAMLGMPECRIPLAQAAIYVSTAPKSNASYLAIDGALADIEQQGAAPMPYYLKDGTSLSLERKHKVDSAVECYKYPHDYKGGYVPQQYLPDRFKSNVYYRPTERGHEKDVMRRKKYEDD